MSKYQIVRVADSAILYETRFFDDAENYLFYLKNNYFGLKFILMGGENE